MQMGSVSRLDPGASWMIDGGRRPGNQGLVEAGSSALVVGPRGWADAAVPMLGAPRTRRTAR